MMKNISGKNNEEELIKAIAIVRKDLENVVEKGRCKFYSGHLVNELIKRNVPSRLINSLDLGLDYEHEFVLVPNNDINGGYFLADLTFSQFQSDSNLFTKLINDGYQPIGDVELTVYLNTISHEEVKTIYSPDDLFFATVDSIKKQSGMSR